MPDEPTVYVIPVYTARISHPCNPFVFYTIDDDGIWVGFSCDPDRAVCLGHVPDVSKINEAVTEHNATT